MRLLVDPGIAPWEVREAAADGVHPHPDHPRRLGSRDGHRPAAGRARCGPAGRRRADPLRRGASLGREESRPYGVPVEGARRHARGRAGAERPASGTRSARGGPTSTPSPATRRTGSPPGCRRRACWSSATTCPCTRSRSSTTRPGTTGRRWRLLTELIERDQPATSWSATAPPRRRPRARDRRAGPRLRRGADRLRRRRRRRRAGRRRAVPGARRRRRRRRAPQQRRAWPARRPRRDARLDRERCAAGRGRAARRRRHRDRLTRIVGDRYVAEVGPEADPRHERRLAAAAGRGARWRPRWPRCATSSADAGRHRDHLGGDDRRRRPAGLLERLRASAWSPHEPASMLALACTAEPASGDAAASPSSGWRPTRSSTEVREIFERGRRLVARRRLAARARVRHPLPRPHRRPAVATADITWLADERAVFLGGALTLPRVPRPRRLPGAGARRAGAKPAAAAATCWSPRASRCRSRSCSGSGSRWSARSRCWSTASDGSDRPQRVRPGGQPEHLHPARPRRRADRASAVRAVDGRRRRRREVERGAAVSVRPRTSWTR